ncbi:hypothetical protein BJ944DRAFT_244078 [Cunninghamella echinulata]|nr:hypothetical protein BJ944DRAFT_244078 [Cunninghamella echinulata]
MSLWKSTTFGCVYYIHEFHEIYFLAEINDVDLELHLQDIIEQLYPTHFVLSTANDLLSNISSPPSSLPPPLLEPFIQQNGTLSDSTFIKQAQLRFSCLISMGAVQQKYIKLQITENSELIIEKRRHPLYELSDNFIANDAHLVGSIASKAILGITDKIFTSVQTSDTVSMMTQATHYATENSLAIIDGFGKGTNTINGTSLFGGILTHYISKGKSCPKVAASTHFHDLIAKGILNEEYISFYTTEIMCNSRINATTSTSTITSIKSEKISFLYRIIPGKETALSYGQWYVSLGGLPEIIVLRSNQLIKEFINGKKYNTIYSKYDEEHYGQLEVLLNQFIQS